MKLFLKFQRMISLLLIVAIVVTQTPSQVLAHPWGRFLPSVWRRLRLSVQMEQSLPCRKKPSRRWRTFM